MCFSFLSQLGESWFTHDACTERCTCNSNNNITCTGWACGPPEICGVQDGELGCYPLGEFSLKKVPRVSSVIRRFWSRRTFSRYFIPYAMAQEGADG